MRHWDSKRRLWMPGLSRGMTIFVLFIAIGSIFAVTQIDLTTQVKGILASANGGTGSAFFGITGPTAGRTYTLPDSNATLEFQANKNAANGYAGLSAGSKLTLSQMQEVMGVADLSDFAGKSGSGTTAIGATITTPSTNQVLTWNGSNWINQASSGAISFGDTETPTGTVNGVNATFTLTNSPSPAASLMLFKNGQLMIPGGADYTLTGNSIVYVAGAKPLTGDVHVAFYRF